MPQGGFQSSMTRREAALILGIRESAAEERVKEAHRKIMIANHPDAGMTCMQAAQDLQTARVHVHPFVGHHEGLPGCRWQQLHCLKGQ